MNEINGGFDMQDKQVFKGVKLTECQAAKVQRLADQQFEGNFSMALRHILNSVMAGKVPQL